jgi:hypothetical protein
MANKTVQTPLVISGEELQGTASAGSLPPHIPHPLYPLQRSTATPMKFPPLPSAGVPFVALFIPVAEWEEFQSYKAQTLVNKDKESPFFEGNVSDWNEICSNLDSMIWTKPLSEAQQVQLQEI